VRAIATGASGPNGRALPGQALATPAQIAAHTSAPIDDITASGSFWIVHRKHEIVVVDRFGDPVATVRGVQCEVGDLEATVEQLTRFRGPVTLRPTIWVIAGGRVAELSSDDMIAVAQGLHDPADPSEVILVGRKS